MFKYATAFAAGTLLALGAAKAETDYDNPEFHLQNEVGNFTLTVDSNENAARLPGSTTVRADYTFVEYEMPGNVKGAFAMGVGYDRVEENASIHAVYEAAYTVNKLALTADVDLAYVTPRDDLGDGSAFATPSFGVAYGVNDRVSPFANVSYAFSVSEDFGNREGGVAELGVNFNMSDNVTVTPSVVRYFDNNNAEDNTQFRLGGTFRF